MFKRTKLSGAVVAAIASMTCAPQLFAQENTTLEEVTVTGIRASMERAMDIKRDSSGVVDAISAEDIGKFPDTNLAESLQRITGVSISRENGEGAEVTVRGFGPESNMVTLNGRTMPTGTMYAGASGEGFQRTNASRAFNFANLASENVSGVEVYKTGKAEIASGGIGATININTARPLDNPEFVLSIGAKGVHDTTNRSGDDITPEFTSLVSWANESETFGASLAFSHQQRDSGYSGVTVNEWLIGTWGEDNLYNPDALGGTPEEVYGNMPEEGQLYARPTDFRYAFSDTHRERNNGQLTLQFAPNEKFGATVDYLYAGNDIEENRGEITNWLQNGNAGGTYSRIEFDDSAIATPTLIRENYSGGTVDIGYEQQFRSQSNTLKSLGLNLEYQVNDKLSLSLDAHDSSMESLPTGPGGSGELAMGLGAPVVMERTLDYSGKTPAYGFVTSVPNNALTAANVGSSILRTIGARSQNDVQQFKLDGQWEFDNGRFDFGVESRTVEMDASRSSDFNQTLGNWGVNNPGEFPEDMLDVINVPGEFDDYNTGSSPGVAFRGDAVALAQYAAGLYDGICLCVAETNNFHNILEEQTNAAYFQVELSGELGGFPVNLLTGARYETTDVDSASQVNPIGYLEWQSDNDFVTGPAGEAELARETASYDNLLPSMDLSINLTEDVVSRFSYSKTISRPSYNNLAVSPSGFATNGSTLLGSVPRAQLGNPALQPLESSNFDLSTEWYYTDSSYVSVGFFEKRVSKFIGTGQEMMTHFDIRDQTNGPRALAAQAELESLNLPLNDGTLHAMMVFMQNDPTELLAAADAWVAEDPDNRSNPFPDGAVFDGTGAQVNWLAENAPGNNLAANSDDPLTEFLTSRPINNREAKIHGMEFAVQHFFGETGFGVQANYTFVRGDVGFNNLGLPTEQQFALTGLSDTANLVLLYENYGFQGRLAYNWRDSFLTGTNIQSANNPLYVGEYSQIDFGLSYDVSDQLTVALEGINITGENGETYMRNESMIKTLDDLGARYQLGARYAF